MVDTPTFVQRVLYAYGRRLPDSMRDWVAADLSGPGAIRRHMIRYAIPPALILAHSGCSRPRCTCTWR